MKVLCACTGGGLRGAVQVGMLDALAEKGVAIDAWAGVSTGAIQAGFMSMWAPPQQAYAARQLVDLWLKLSRAPVSGGLLEAIGRALIGKPSLHRNTALRTLLTTYLTKPPVLPLSIGAASLASGGYLGLRPVDVENLVASVLASASVPGLFPPVGPSALVDGGVVYVAPLQPAFDLVHLLWPTGPEQEDVVILLLHCLPLDAERLPLPVAPMTSRWPLWRLAPRGIDMVGTANERASLLAARRTNDVLARDAQLRQTGVMVAPPLSLAGKRYVTIVQLAPTIGPGYGMLGFDKAKLAAYLDHGRTVVRDYFSTHLWPPDTKPAVRLNVTALGGRTGRIL